jgi:hypothetical protein
MSNPSIIMHASIGAGLHSAGAAQGTALVPRFYEGPADIQGDVHLQQRYFTYQTEAGWVAGKTFNVMFTIDRPAKDVWPHLKDFNPWQNSYGHYYSGVLGDLEGKTFQLGSDPHEPGPHQYKVVRVIPEHLIVLLQPVPQDINTTDFSPDCHVFMLNEHDGKTVVTALMEHASLSKDTTEQDALSPFREVAPESQRKWRDIFIPTLKNLIYESSGT